MKRKKCRDIQLCLPGIEQPNEGEGVPVAGVGLAQRRAQAALDRVARAAQAHADELCDYALHRLGGPLKPRKRDRERAAKRAAAESEKEADAASDPLERARWREPPGANGPAEAGGPRGADGCPPPGE